MLVLFKARKPKNRRQKMVPPIFKVPSIENFLIKPVVLLRAGGGLIGGTLVSHLVLNTPPTIWQGGLIGLGAYGIQNLIRSSDPKETVQNMIVSAISTTVLAGLFFAKNYAFVIPTLEKVDLVLSLDQSNKLIALFLTSIVVGQNMENFGKKLDQAFIYNANRQLIETDGLNIRHINLKSLSFQQRKELATIAIDKNPEAFREIGEELQGDYDLALKGVKKDPSLIEFVHLEPLSFQQRKELAKMAVDRDGLNIEHIKLEDLQSEDRKEIALIAVKNPQAFCKIGEELQGDYDLALKAVEQDPSLIEFVKLKPLSFQQRKELAKMAIDKNASNIEHIKLEQLQYKDRKEIAFVAVRKIPSLIRFLHLEHPLFEKDKKSPKIPIEGDSGNVQQIPNGFLRVEDCKEIAIQAVLLDNKVFDRLPKYLQEDPEIILTINENKTNKVTVVRAVRKSGAIHLASKELQSDFDVILAAVESGRSVKDLPLSDLEQKDRKKIAFVAVMRDGFELDHLEEFKEDEDIVRAAVTQNGKALQFAIADFKKDIEILKLAVRNNGLAIEHAPEVCEYIPGVNGKEEYLDVIRLAARQNGHCLDFIANLNLFIDDSRIFVNAVKSDGCLLDSLPLDPMSNEDLLKKAVVQDGAALKLLTNPKTKKPIVTLAVEHHPLAIEHVPPNLWEDNEIELMAISRREDCFELLSEDLKENREFALQAIQKNPRTFKFVPLKFREDQAFILEALRMNPKSLKFVPDSLKTNDRFLSRARNINNSAVNDWIR
jgi:predicted nuclease of restriction endonuclease-like (RecB) superfamily